MKLGPTLKEAEQNLSDFADTMSQGPKYQERQRIRKLKSQAMFGVVDGPKRINLDDYTLYDLSDKKEAKS